MNYKIFAFIVGEEVKNIAVCNDLESAVMICKGTYGEDSFAVDATDYKVSIGCTYKDGQFYKDGVVIPNTSVESRLEALESANKIYGGAIEELASIVGGE